ncbi:MAG: MarR family transcriptional regulator [Clostridia bacterium]|nr:MarR family transcriptional regulator [Clostridia bacterium]
MKNLTISELKYLLTIDEGEGKLRMVDIAKINHISKPSVLQAITRLEKAGYIVKGETISLTDEGSAILSEYKTIVGWLKNHLSAHCGVPVDIACEDAIKCACCFCDLSRKNVVKFVEETVNASNSKK